MLSRLSSFFKTSMALTLLIASGSVCRVEASVFQSLGASWEGWFDEGGLNWSPAYKTRMVVNDKMRVMYLYSARYDQPVAQQLKNKFEGLGATFVYSKTADGLTGIARRGDQEVSVLVTSPASEPRHLIFLTYRKTNGKKVIPEVVSAYPGSRKLSSVVNLDTGHSYRTYVTKDHPNAVHEYYENLMQSGGWVSMTPKREGRVNSPDTIFYQRKNKVCCIQVRQTDGISSTITILVKKGTV